MSQLRCGYLTMVRAADGITFRGRINLIDRLNGPLTRRQHPQQKTDDSPDRPDYEVFYTRGTDEFALGAAWSKNNPKVGDFLSITLDNPNWNAPLNLTAFPPRPGSTDRAFSIVWQRPRGAKVQNETTNEMENA